MAVGRFSRPIPGMSITGELGKYPFEKPPQMVDLEEVFQYYMNRLANEDTIDDIALVCKMGVPLKPIVKSMLTVNEMEGKHSLDIGLLIAPVLHAFLKGAIEAQTGEKVRDDDRDYKTEIEAKEMAKFKALTMKYLSDIDKQGDPGVELLKDIVEPEATPEETPEEPVEEKPMGLMAKG